MYNATLYSITNIYEKLRILRSCLNLCSFSILFYNNFFAREVSVNAKRSKILRICCIDSYFDIIIKILKNKNQTISSFIIDF